MTTDSEMSVAEEQAFQLAQAALKLDQGREARSQNPALLVSALEENLEIWVKIKTIVQRDDCTLPPTVRENLTQLGSFVAAKTFGHAVDISDSTLDALININLQISEGLLEGNHGPSLKAVS